MPHPTANTSPNGLYLQHSTYSSQSLQMHEQFVGRVFDQFFTYTTFANSNSPNIKCLGRFSTVLVTDIRRVRGAAAPVLSLFVKDIEGRRSPIKTMKVFRLS